MTQNETLVSVIVAAYNIEKYIKRCLDSLVEQTYKQLEIIVVDDGSSDHTFEICDEYAEKYENIRVIHKKNGGLSSARNEGLKKAQGSYIGYVDGDDFVEKDMYENMLKACLDKNADIALCSYRQVGEGAEEIRYTGNMFEMTREEALELFISGHEHYHIYNSVWSKLFKREVVENITFMEGRKSEDIMYSTMALVKASKCVFLDTPYYNYIVDRKDSIMNSDVDKRRFQDEIPAWKEQMEYLKSKGFEELAGKAAYQFYRKMLFYYIDFREKKMGEPAKKMAELFDNDKKIIHEIYQKSYVTKGDKARMKLFLFSPGLYYRTVKLYDKIVIPLRRRK